MRWEEGSVVAIVIVVIAFGHEILHLVLNAVEIELKPFLTGLLSGRLRIGGGDFLDHRFGLGFRLDYGGGRLRLGDIRTLRHREALLGAVGGSAVKHCDDIASVGEREAAVRDTDVGAAHAAHAQKQSQTL